MNSECCKDGHKFEPRYDEKEEVNQEALSEQVSLWRWAEADDGFPINYMDKSKIYVCDICTKCGLKIQA